MHASGFAWPFFDDLQLPEGGDAAELHQHLRAFPAPHAAKQD